MTAQPNEGPEYVVIVWDYDAAPDAEEYFTQDYTEEQLAESIQPYYCRERRRIKNLREAIGHARYMVEEKYCVGASVFKDKVSVFGIGMQFGYRDKYL